MDGLSDKITAAAKALANEQSKHPTHQLLDETQDAIDYMADLKGKQLLDARVKCKNIIRKLVKHIIVNITSAKSAGFNITLQDGTILTGDTAKIGQYQVSIKE